MLGHKFNYRVLHVITTAVGLLILIRTLPAMDIGSWKRWIIFVILALIAKALPARLTVGGTFSVAFLIDLAMIVIFGPVTAINVAAITTFIIEFIPRLINKSLKREYLIKIVYRVGKFTLLVGMAGLGYNLIREKYTAFGIAFLIYFLGDIFFLAAERTLDNMFSFKKNWEIFLKTLSLNYLLLAPLAFFMTVLFKESDNTQILTILLFFVPLMVVNHSYRLYMSMRQTYERTVRTMAAAIEAQDPFARGHAEQVAEYTMAIAESIGYKESQFRKLYYIALLHDVGKIGVSVKLLHKQKPLTREEYAEIQKHAVIGASIIEKIKFLNQEADIIRHHHERYDGTGYPNGLKGEEIPLGARILSLADSIAAMTAERPYRKAKTLGEALREAKKLAGTQFDPFIVDSFIHILKRKGEI